MRMVFAINDLNINKMGTKDDVDEATRRTRSWHAFFNIKRMSFNNVKTHWSLCNKFTMTTFFHNHLFLF